jgi:hypothetical protein
MISIPRADSILLLLLLVTVSCSRQPNPPAAAARSFSLGQSASVGDLSLAHSSSQLLAVYTNPTTLSLVLSEVALDDPKRPSCTVEPGPTTHFERISDSAEVGALFGNHVLLARPARIDLFYHDLQADGRELTKWVHRSAPDPNWWIDVLPLSGLLLAALPDGSDGVRLVYQVQQTVYVSRSSAPEKREVLAAPFEAASRGQPVEDDPEGSFTLYDRLSKRIYLVADGPDGLSVRAVCAGGQLHFARLVNGRTVLMVYDRARAAIVVLEEQDTPGQYKSYRITPTEQTSIVYFGEHAGSRYYLFDEYDSTAPEERRYSLALLLAKHPGATPTYTKLVLAAAPRPLRACQVVQVDSCLFVLCARDTLSLIAVSLAHAAHAADAATDD